MKITFKTWFKIYILRRDVCLNLYITSGKEILTKDQHRAFRLKADNYFLSNNVPDDAAIIESHDIIDRENMYRATWMTRSDIFSRIQNENLPYPICKMADFIS